MPRTITPNRYTQAEALVYWTTEAHSRRMHLRRLQEQGVPAWHAKAYPGRDTIADARQHVATAEARIAELSTPNA